MLVSGGLGIIIAILLWLLSVILTTYYDAVYENDISPIVLIGEEDPILDPYNFARKLFTESNYIWNTNISTWKTEINRPDIFVGSKPVIGYYEHYQLPIQRARILLKTKFTAEQIYTYLISREGHLLLSPLSSLEGPAIASFDWYHGSLNIFHRVKRIWWPFLDRECVTYDISNTEMQTFVSKSIRISNADRRNMMLLDKLENEQEREQNMITTTHTFALRVKDLNKSGMVESAERNESYHRNDVHELEVEFINYAVVFPNFAVYVTHYINAQLYFPMVLTSLKKLIN